MFNMDKAYALRTPTIVHALEKKTNQFGPKKEGEEVLGTQYPYICVISALLYLQMSILVYQSAYV
jgi:hypothetical protein